MLNKQKGLMYEWVTHTWNPIRGKCPHDCSYCLDGNTLILMADLSFKKLKDIEIGNIVMGIEKTSRYSKFVPSKVTAKNKKEDYAYKIDTLDTSVICSLEHKWLINRGRWRSLVNGLKTGMNIKQVNKFSYEETQKDNDYKKGYLRGIIFGDGTIKKYVSNEQKIIRNGKEYIYSPKKIFKFRLSMKDKEAILRAKEYLSYFGIETFDHIHEGLSSIRKDGEESYYKLLRIIEPINNDSFKAGYLGGIFDAEGSFSKGALRIHNRYLFECKSYLDYFGFKVNLACRKNTDINTITIKGGLNEHIRFFSISQSSIKKKRQRFLKAIKTGYSKIISYKAIGLRELYDIQTSTENFIANGLVSHNCYMKVFPQGELRLDKKALKDDLGAGNFIFVGSSTDMWAKEVPSWWIGEVLAKCLENRNNKYLFQTKNPRRFAEFCGSLSFLDCYLGTTIETNINHRISKAPTPVERFGEMVFYKDFKTMVSLEPLMDFDVDILVSLIKDIGPEFVSIGADSKGHGLPEPSKEKVEKLIEKLSKITKVRLKRNLERLQK